MSEGGASEIMEELMDLFAKMLEEISNTQDEEAKNQVIVFLKTVIDGATTYLPELLRMCKQCSVLSPKDIAGLLTMAFTRRNVVEVGSHTRGLESLPRTDESGAKKSGNDQEMKRSHQLEQKEKDRNKLSTKPSTSKSAPIVTSSDEDSDDSDDVSEMMIDGLPSVSKNESGINTKVAQKENASVNPASIPKRNISTSEERSREERNMEADEVASVDQRNLNSRAKNTRPSSPSGKKRKLTVSAKLKRLWEQRANPSGEMPAPGRKLGSARNSASLNRRKSSKNAKPTHVVKKGPFICCNTNCGKSFSNSSNLYRHQRNCGRQVRYACTDCEKSYSSMENLRGHQQQHRGGWKCNLCEETLFSAVALSRHRKKCG